MSSLRSSNGVDNSASLLSDHHDPYSNTDRGGLVNRQDSSWSPDTATSTSSYTSSDVDDVAAPKSSLLSRLERRGRILWWHLIFNAVMLTYALTERYALTSTTTSLLPVAQIQALNDLTHPLFPNHSIASNDTFRTRVVYFVIDGLRYDATYTSPALSSLLVSLYPHVAVRHSYSQVPSMSHPNWITLATGVPTWLHGQIGNDGVVEQAWSSVWSETLRAGVPNGVAGAFSWLRLFWSHFTPLTGDGTVTGFGIEDAVYKRGESEAVVDAAYNANLHRAIQSRSFRRDKMTLFDYELFMAYHSDVDGESHSFGADSPQTQQAIADKARYIQDAIAAIEAVDAVNAANGIHFTTTYVITADHGHVDVGGHGGDADVLRRIPLVVYRNNSYLSSTNGTVSGSCTLPPPPASYSPSNVDIATTVSALAGVRVPRSSTGMFVSDVMGVLLGCGSLVYLHYADLFVQKRALARSLLSVMGQSTSSELLDDSNDAVLLPQPSDGLNYTALIVVLNDRTGDLLQMMERGRQTHLSQQLAVSWVLATLLLLLVLLPVVAWVYNSSTFISIGAVIPQRVAAFFSYLSFLIHYAFASCYRIIHRSTVLPTRQWTNHSTASLRLNRITSAIGLVLIILWLLLMLFEFNVIFHYGYRSDSDWQWQMTLWNSVYDAYVMSIGFCMGASLIVCMVVHLVAFLLLRTASVWDRLLQWLQLDAVGADGGAACTRAVVQYHVLLYVSLFTSLLSVLLLWSQSYHCFYLPFIGQFSSIAVTPSIMAARFQSFSIAAMLAPAWFYLRSVVWWQQRQLWSGMVASTVAERAGEDWWQKKHTVLLALAGLDEKGSVSI